MSLRTRKPPFVVASMTTMALGVLAAGMLLTRRQVPERSPSALIESPGEYVQAGARQNIDWKQLSPSILNEARRADRPIFLTIAVPWHQSARRLDSTIFRDENVSRYLNRHFMCVRVDGLEHPSFLRAFLPLSRVGAKTVPGFQMWMVTPQGVPFDLIPRDVKTHELDAGNLLRALVNAKRTYEKIRTAGDVADRTTEVMSAQASDLAALGTGVSAALDFEAFRAEIASRSEPKLGGIVDQGYQQLYPQALRYQSHVRDVALRDSVWPLFIWGVFDPVHGGFFNQGQSETFLPIDVTKNTVKNAELAQVMAEIAAWSGGKVFRFAAERTFDFLCNEMSSPRGFYGGVSTIVDRRGRSIRYSFGHRDLSELYPGPLGFGLSREGALIQQRLGLAEVNPQALPRLTPEAIENLEAMIPILDRLAKERPLNPIRLAGQGYTDIHGTATARLLETARLLGGDERIQKVSQFVEQLYFFVSQEGVRRKFNGNPDNEYLGDLLSAADAYLQDFLLTGRVPSLLNARTILSWVQRDFDSPGGPLMVRKGDPILDPWNHQIIELLDTQQESLSARYARLAITLFRLLPSGPDQVAKGAPRTMAEDALGLLNAEGGNAQTIGYRASGFMVAGLITADDVHAFAVGPDAVERANQLVRLRPGRLIAPAAGPVRPDLQTRKPGFYVVNLGQVEGPLDLETAASRIPERFRTDRSL